jgi:hypothetical protein
MQENHCRFMGLLGRDFEMFQSGHCRREGDVTAWAGKVEKSYEADRYQSQVRRSSADRARRRCIQNECERWCKDQKWDLGYQSLIAPVNRTGPATAAVVFLHD